MRLRTLWNTTVATGAAACLALAFAGSAEADFRATGEISGFVCGSAGCDEARFDDAEIPGNFELVNGAVFEAVTAHDAEACACRINLADATLADASASMRNLTQAKFYASSHDGRREVQVTALQFACVEE